MTAYRSVLPVLLAACLGVGSEAAARGWNVEAFDEAEVLVEINATDGDAGFQGMIDGKAWRSARLRGPRWRPLFHFSLFGSARKQGFTEFVWESAEPQFDELSFDEFLERFPIQYAPSSDETSMLETPEYSPDELQAIEKRLMELGYLE